jgi:hypothetical protein
MHISIACATALLLLGSVMCMYGIRVPHVVHTEIMSEKLASER